MGHSSKITIIPQKVDLTTEIVAIVDGRNDVKSIIDWQFHTPDARIKLKMLYPSISE
jgi:hypothetical protein